MKNRINLSSVFFVALFGFMLNVSAVGAGEYAVIGNAGNPISGDAARAEVKNIFLKKKTVWPNNVVGVPFDRSADSAEHKAFAAVVLGMEESVLKSYWGSEKAKTGTTPPREIGSDNILLRQVKRKEGAFGVVSADTSLPDGVRVLFKFSD